MSIKPILFNTDMVRAILDGRKAVTRRVVKLPKYVEKQDDGLYTLYADGGNYKDQEIPQILDYLIHPYQPGDIIYVRETWGNWNYDDPNCWAAYYQYRADYPDGAKTYMYDEENECDLPKWHPSIHMPKEAARIWLKVTNVRVERLQDITMEQCVKEGLVDSRGFIHSPGNEYGDLRSHKLKFQSLWDSTLKKPDIDRYGWDANPWVWVIEFEQCEKPQEENH